MVRPLSRSRPGASRLLRTVSHVAGWVVSLAVLVVLATLFLDTVLILVGLLTSIAATVRPLRAWVRGLAASAGPPVPVADELPHAHDSTTPAVAPERGARAATVAGGAAAPRTAAADPPRGTNPGADPEPLAGVVTLAADRAATDRTGPVVLAGTAGKG